MTVVLAIDHGNGHVKACSSDKFILLPSCYSRPEEFGVDMILPKKDLQVFEFKSTSYPGETYYWGRDVNKAGKLIATYGGEGRYISKPYRLLSQFTMALLLPDEEMNCDDVLIVTGCPSVNTGTELEADIQQVFCGRHVVSVNGQTKIVNVKQVKILPQPLGTIFSLYFNDDGRVVNRQLEDSYVGIIDIGSGTTDLDGVKALKRQWDDTATIQLGMFDAYKKIANYINRVNPNANATPQMVEQHLLHPEIDINTYKVNNRSKPVDITNCRTEVFRKLAEDILNYIQQMWANRSKFDAIYLTGGGAKPLAKYFMEWEKDIQILDDSQQSNVLGFYRFGLNLLG
jgi:plasmid segregation protein ParM